MFNILFWLWKWTVEYSDRYYQNIDENIETLETDISIEVIELEFDLEPKTIIIDSENSIETDIDTKEIILELNC